MPKKWSVAGKTIGYGGIEFSESRFSSQYRSKNKICKLPETAALVKSEIDNYINNNGKLKNPPGKRGKDAMFATEFKGSPHFRFNIYIIDKDDNEEVEDTYVNLVPLDTI